MACGREGTDYEATGPGRDQGIIVAHGSAPAGAPGTYALHEEEPEQAPSLRDLLDILRRRRAIALQTLVVVVALGVVLTLMTKPIYRSTARLLVQGKLTSVNINNTINPLSSILTPSAGHDAETQVEILRSSSLTDRVYKQAGLGIGTVDLDIRRVRDTDVIEASATSHSPQAAFGFIDMLPRVYLNDVRGDRLRSITSALSFAQRRLQEENTKLNASEAKLQKFKQRAGLVDLAAQKTGEITAVAQARDNLAKAQENAASLGAQLKALQEVRRSIPDDIENATTTSNTGAIQALQQRLDDLKSQRKDLTFQYKEGQPEIVRVDKQIADLQARLSQTPRTLTTRSRQDNPAVAGYDAKIADARAALSAAQADLIQARQRAGALGAGLGRYNSIELEQAGLQRDIASSTGARESLAASVEELSLREKALEAADDPISTIEAASPAVKVSPSLSRNLILALGTLLACGAAMLQESLDDHIHDEDEARRLLNTPILGHFPLMTSQPSLVAAAQSRSKTPQLSANGANGDSGAYGDSGANGAGAELNGAVSTGQGGVEMPPVLDLAGAQGYSRNVLERFRVLRSNVQFTSVDHPHHTLLITSAVPQEGKSYTASNLAVAMALDGRRVLLIDADLHRPRMHEVLEVPLQPGLTNVLVGQAQLEACLHETSVPGLRLLTAGVLPPNPVELLNSPTMEAVLDKLSALCDIIIFDSPPLLATADAQVLASKVDGVLYVMQLGRVPRSSVLRSFELLQQARANVIGIVLNKIDDKTGRNSHYGYRSYHYGYYDDDSRPPRSPARAASGTPASTSSAQAASTHAEPVENAQPQP